MGGSSTSGETIPLPVLAQKWSTSKSSTVSYSDLYSLASDYIWYSFRFVWITRIFWCFKIRSLKGWVFFIDFLQNLSMHCKCTNECNADSSCRILWHCMQWNWTTITTSISCSHFTTVIERKTTNSILFVWLNYFDLLRFCRNLIMVASSNGRKIGRLKILTFRKFKRPENSSASWRLEGILAEYWSLQKIKLVEHFF